MKVRIIFDLPVHVHKSHGTTLWDKSNVIMIVHFLIIPPLRLKGSPFDKQNRLALDSKIYKALFGLKGLNIDLLWWATAIFALTSYDLWSMMFVMLLSDKGDMHVNCYLAKNVHNYFFIFFSRAGLHLPRGHPSLHGFWCLFTSDPSWTVWSILVSWTWKRYSVIKILC